MSLYRVWRMIERVWTGCVRDTRTIFALVLVPVGAVLLVGYVMRESGETANVALVVTANEWAGQDASLFIEESLSEDGVDHYRASDVDSAEQHFAVHRLECLRQILYNKPFFQNNMRIIRAF